MKKFIILIAFFFGLSLFMPVMSQEWQTPVINGYGKIKIFKDAAVQPAHNQEYRILFHITNDKQKDGVNAGLWHIARLVNLFGVTGVDKKYVKIVAVISGDATPIVMTDKAYKTKYYTNNPNLDLMEQLTKYGVAIKVCGQAAAEHDLDVNKDVNTFTQLTLSALIDIPVYEMKGYVVMF